MSEALELLRGVDLTKLAKADKLALLELLQTRERLIRENALARYQPYPKQAEFHAAGGFAGVRERLLVAGNQVGKCATVTSYIDLADGTRATCGELFEAGQPFEVLALDGGRVVTALAVTPIRKPAEPCVRVWFSDGQWLELALGHRMLSASGEYCRVEHLLGSVPCLRVSSSAPGRSVPSAGGRRWSGRLQGFLVGCLRVCRSGDARLHRASSAARAWLRQRACAPAHSLSLSPVGALAGSGTSSLRQARGPLSSSRAPRRFGGRFAASAARYLDTLSRLWRRGSRSVQRRLVAGAVRLRSDGAAAPGQAGFERALFSPMGGVGNQIVAYERIASQPVYDFTVPRTANYLTAGCVHHNTWSAGFEVAMHLTGLYPDWWVGKRWKRPVFGWASGVTGESTRDNPQRILLGRVGDWGTGAIPAAAIQPLDKSIVRSAHGVADAVDHVKVKHVSGGISLLYFKHYSQGREKWQGESLDFVWFDEEPPEDIYTEGLTRTNATKGITFITFTPLLGMSNVVKRFLLDKQPGTHVTQMTIEDALHYTPEQRAAIVASYPAHEREARTMGIPIMGSGRVFPVEEGAFSEGRIDIPHWWPRIAAIDFGWDHPTAAVWLAWDRDTDTIHVYDCYRVRQESVLIHSEAIKSRGAWIPVAWPHDGRNETAQAQGVSLSQQYRKRGVNMLKDAATWPDGSNGVEAGLMDMLDRMQTGRLRVASHLNDWWEEFRIYHRDDGKLVKKGDDLMSATRYAIMMLRKAEIMPTMRVDTAVTGYGVLDLETGF